MSRWQRFRRFMGWTWRKPEGCSHPKDRRQWDDGCAFGPDGDIVCGDCGRQLYDGSLNRWLAAEPYR